jgi:hypothetical protein
MEKRKIVRPEKPPTAAVPTAGAPLTLAKPLRPVPLPPSAPLEMGTMTLTVRIRPRLVLALRHATVARRDAKIAPYTQPAIVEEALERWLHDAGFLDEG